MSLKTRAEALEGKAEGSSSLSVAEMATRTFASPQDPTKLSALKIGGGLLLGLIGTLATAGMGWGALAGGLIGVALGVFGGGMLDQTLASERKKNALPTPLARTPLAETKAPVKTVEIGSVKLPAYDAEANPPLPSKLPLSQDMLTAVVLRHELERADDRSVDNQVAGRLLVEHEQKLAGRERKLRQARDAFAALADKVSSEQRALLPETANVPGMQGRLAASPAHLTEEEKAIEAYGRTLIEVDRMQADKAFAALAPEARQSESKKAWDALDKMAKLRLVQDRVDEHIRDKENEGNRFSIGAAFPGLYLSAPTTASDPEQKKALPNLDDAQGATWYDRRVSNARDIANYAHETWLGLNIPNFSGFATSAYDKAAGILGLQESERGAFEQSTKNADWSKAAAIIEKQMPKLEELAAKSKNTENLEIARRFRTYFRALAAKKGIVSYRTEVLPKELDLLERMEKEAIEKAKTLAPKPAAADGKDEAPAGERVGALKLPDAAKDAAALVAVQNIKITDAKSPGASQESALIAPITPPPSEKSVSATLNA